MADSNSFTSHFVELRSRLLNSLIFIFVAFIVSYIFAEHIYNFLVEPYANAVKDDQIRGKQPRVLEVPDRQGALRPPKSALLVRRHPAAPPLERNAV